MENKKPRTEAVVSNLPDDVIIEIISRLHVKELTRFKCVSKSWLSLIHSDSHFSFLQLERAASSDRPLVFMERTDSSNSNSRNGVYRNSNGIYAPKIYHYLFYLDSLEDRNIGLVEIHNPFDQDGVPRRDIDGMIVASLDGLLVLQQWDTHALALLNPSTGKSHLVPPNPAGNKNVVFGGIGYDYGRDCYKLVTIIDGAYDLMIYDVSHAWRKVQFQSQSDSVERLYSANTLNYIGRYANNALYWGVYFDEDWEEAVLGFDIDEEEFFEPELPDFGDTLFKFSELVSFDDKLCLVCRWKKNDESWTRVGGEKERVDIWVMNETYDEDEEEWSSCWVKLFSISNPKFKLRSIEFYSACRDKVLFNADYQRIVWYNIEKEEFEEFSNPIKNSHFTPARTCVPSLMGNGIF